MQSTFKIIKSAGQLAGALLFERHDGEKLVVLLGSMADFTIGFDVASLSNIESIDLLQNRFKPQAPGANMVLENHQVRIMIGDIMPTLQRRPDERPHQAGVTSTRGFKRFKNAWKNP